MAANVHDGSRLRLGGDVTIERMPGGGVRLVRWRQADGLSVAETIQEWSAIDWCTTVLAVSDPGRKGQGNLALVLLEIERIHGRS